MAKTPYDIDLDRNPANFQPLTPLQFLERAASTHPDHTAIIHGPLRRNWAQLYARLSGLRVHAPQAVPTTDALERLAALIEAGKVTPVIDRRFDLTHAPDAIEYVEREHARAKVVITIPTTKGHSDVAE